MKGYKVVHNVLKDSKLNVKIFNLIQTVYAVPSGRATYGAYGLGPLGHWDRGFESRSRHGCISAFLYIVLSCVSRGLTMGRSPVQGVLPTCLKRLII